MSEVDTSDLSTELAIIGMAGRFPQAQNLDEFWEKLRSGTELISFFSDEELLADGVDTQLLKNPNFVKAGGVMEGIELFDAHFFGYTPREAEVLDPQQRHFLECSWEALENAGYDPDRYSGSIGVFAGCSISNYFLQNLISHPQLLDAMGNFQLGILNDKDYLATRVSYKLNLRGPSISIQTACSTSLVAIHQACQSVLNGECEMALAGGVSISLLRKLGYLYQEGGIVSPDGHCRAFDAAAQGMVGGNGVGVVLIKRLAEALSDGDNILAVIKGSAVNNDGSLKIGYTAPSIDGQANVIAEAQAVAGVDAGRITYVETHGTGTNLGDPIEVTALTKAFRATTDRKGFCGIGSVKTNMGHLDAAAGVAGFIKTVLSLQHKFLAPSLHFQTPNPRIDFENSPFYVVAKPTEWGGGSVPRRAAVSSFGIGGTNAHAILEEAPVVKASSESRPWQLLLLSAKTLGALETATSNLVAHLKKEPQINLADVAFTLQVGRKHFEHRRAVVGRDVADAVELMETLDPRRVFSSTTKDQKTSIAFMFTGQGSQYAGMAAGLYEHEPAFRLHVDRCAELLKPHLGLDLRDVIYPRETDVVEAGEVLKQTSMTQPALFVVEYALAQLLMQWGIKPDAMIGHSIGEYVAACVADVFSLEDALKLVAERGRLMQRMPRGAMLSVRLSEAEVEEFLSSDVDLAVVNAPSQCVLAGPVEAIDRLEKQLQTRKIDCTRLHTSHAFHSAMMKPVLGPFMRIASAVKRNAPRIPFVSNVTGTWITAEQAVDPEYWAKHLAQTVRFAAGVEILAHTGAVLLEVGPGQTLSTLARKQLSAPQVALSSLRRPAETANDHEFLLKTIGRLWLAGVKIDWSGFYADERRRRVPLPTYPFERERYWLDPGTMPQAAVPQPISTGKLPEIAEWFYSASWQQSLLPVASHDRSNDSARCLVFAGEDDLSSRIVEQLERNGHDVITARVGASFERVDDDTFTVNVAASDDYETLIRQLRANEKIPQRVLHLWNAAPPGHSTTSESFASSQDEGAYSLLFLARALEKSGVTERLQVGVVTANMQNVSGGETFSPARSTVLAACTVIPQEYPNITCRSIDIDESSSARTQKLVFQLISEMTGPAKDSVIAYRGACRWTRTFVPLSLREPANTRLRQRGVYLIVGSGRTSDALAEYLTRTVDARIVWASDIKQQVAAVHGVFFTGAIDADAPRLTIGEITRSEINRRFENTAQTLISLAEALRDEELDFCVLMSSLSAVLGGPGLFSAASQAVFMDAFAAQQNRTQSTPWISIDWDLWEFANDDAGKVELAITPEEGMEALRRVLGHDLVSPVIVSTGDLHARIARWINRQPAHERKEEKSSTHPRPKLANAFVAPGNKLETTVVQIWQSLLGIEGIGVEDNLFDLGGDSLLAIQIVSRIRETLHVEIPLRSIFETPTVAAVVASIAQHQQNADAQSETIDEVVELVEQLSEDELRILIAEQESLASNA